MKKRKLILPNRKCGREISRRRLLVSLVSKIKQIRRKSKNNMTCSWKTKWTSSRAPSWTASSTRWRRPKRRRRKAEIRGSRRRRPALRAGAAAHRIQRSTSKPCWRRRRTSHQRKRRNWRFSIRKRTCRCSHTEMSSWLRSEITKSSSL